MLFLLLFLVWVFFSGDISVQSLTAGALLSVLTLLLYFRLGIGKLRGKGDEGPQTPGRLLRRLFFLLCFLPVFGWKVVRSGFYIAFLALRPSIDFWPGIVRIKADLPNLPAVTVLANLLTLTPGTLSLEYDEENDDLYVHWIDVSSFGGKEMDETITSGMRPWVRRMFQ